MPTHDPVAAARREAKARVRRGGTTHQKALDAIARETGHANWAVMCANPSKPAHESVRSYVERMRPHGGIQPDDETRVLAEGAISGYLTEPAGTDVADYVDRYEFRGDGFDLAPNVFQRDMLENAIEGYVAELRGPGEPPTTAFGTAVEQAPSLEDVERDIKRIMARQDAAQVKGMTVSQWVSARMREAARQGLAMAKAAAPAPMARLAQLPMTTDNLAYALDPEGGPYVGYSKLTVRCPVHGGDSGERNASLLITEDGFRCMAGCGNDEISATLSERLLAAGLRAQSFMKANDASPVVSGASHNERGGGMGGTYVLVDGSRHKLDTLTCRLLPKGYPRWDLGQT